MASTKLKQKNSSLVSHVKNESKVEWAKILVAVGAGLSLGLIVGTMFFGKEGAIQLIPISINAVLITCVLALLLDIRRLIINMAKA